jgi:hypothetical protein
MKRLIKLISCFFDGNGHPEKIFSNSLFCFYHSNAFIQFSKNSEITISRKANRDLFSVGFFVFNTFKNQNI